MAYESTSAKPRGAWPMTCTRSSTGPNRATSRSINPTKFEFVDQSESRQGTRPHPPARTARGRRRGDRMRRRDFIGAIYGAALALPFAAAAQQPGKVWRIGHVLSSTPERVGNCAQALEQRLADLGYVQGRNIVLLHRFAGPQPEKIRRGYYFVSAASRSVGCLGTIAGMAAKKFAGGVPTVFISIGFPVELGLVQSLAHPGGNMTGIAAEAALETNGKRLQILKEIVPDLKRVAVLRDVR